MQVTGFWNAPQQHSCGRKLDIQQLTFSLPTLTSQSCRKHGKGGSSCRRAQTACPAAGRHDAKGASRKEPFRGFGSPLTSVTASNDLKEEPTREPSTGVGPLPAGVAHGSDPEEKPEPKPGRDSATLQNDAAAESPPATSGSLPEFPMRPDVSKNIVRGRYNAVHLAFIGDAVWELSVRNFYFYPPTRLDAFYDNVRSKVRAEAQAILYELLVAGPLLLAEEQDILRWGHNARVGKHTPKRFAPSQGGKGMDTYKKATALECLVGFLYLTDTARLNKVVQYLLEVPV